MAANSSQSPANPAKIKSHPIHPVPWLSYFTSYLDEYSGYVSYRETADLLVREFEMATTTKYSTFRDTGSSKTDSQKKNRNVLWRDVRETSGVPLEFDGMPFQILSVRILDCQHGPDRYKAQKIKNAAEKQGDKQDHEYRRKRRFLVQDTKKCNCPARIHIREIVKYPEYEIGADSKARREAASKRLRNDLESASKMNGERRFYIKLPKPEEHQSHPVGQAAGLLQQIDGCLVKKIHELVSDGVSRVSEMERHLHSFLKNQIFKGQAMPNHLNRRFYPTAGDIRNHMYRATVSRRHSCIDQENLEEKIKQWKEEQPLDNFFFRPCQDDNENQHTQRNQEHSNINNDENKDDDDDDDVIIRGNSSSNSKDLLFVYQTKWQQDLLSKYGGEICLLDATYKTSKYALPLFFLVVQTNVDYCVVGSFITQHETSAAIEEALTVLKDWNPEWSPPYFMVDFSESEIQAIENVFEDCQVYICDFHREQAWLRWVVNNKHGIPKDDQPKLLNMLRHTACASTEEEYQKAVKSLHSTSLWQDNKAVQQWMTKKWLPHKKKWVRAYRKDRFNVRLNTNNGVERQNRSFKYQYLAENRDKTLSGMVSVPVNQFLPKVIKKYVETNIFFSSSYRQYSKSLPLWLHDRPRDFLTHCKLRHQYSEEIEDQHITVVDHGLFQVRSTTDHSTSYQVNFGDSQNMPSCSCLDWQRSHWPCKHFLAIFRHKPQWGWDKLSPSYQNSPYFRIDDDCLFHIMANDAPPNYLPGNRTSPFPDVPPPTMADHLKEGHLRSPFTDDSSTRKADHKEESNRANDESSDSPNVTSNQQSLKEACRMANHCRDVMRQLQNMTYLCTTPQPLETLFKSLQNAVQDLRPHLESENGIFMETKLPKRSLSLKKAHKTKRTPGSYGTLPVSHKKPSGQKATTLNDVLESEPIPPPPSTMNTHLLQPSTTINILNEHSPQKEIKVNHIDEGCTFSKENDVPHKLNVEKNTLNANKSVTKSPHLHVQQPRTKSEPQQAEPQIQLITEPSPPKKMRLNQDEKAVFGSPCASSCAKGNNIENESMNSRMAKSTVTTEQDKTIFTVIDDTSPDPKQWVTFSDNTNDIYFRLYEASKSNIYNSKGWLTDSEIHAAQQLLKTQFPHIDGLNDPDIIKADMVTPAISEFIQIVNTGMHWICLSTLGCPVGFVKLYDSLFSRPSATAILTASQMLFHTGKEITVSNQKVQQQKGSSDCGLFAIAFATTLCFGGDPVETKYDQPLLREHYIKCLESHKMIPFPTTDKRVPMLKSVSKAIVPIYCTCRIPDDGKRYVACYMCHEWFHPECVKAPAWAINSKRSWKCHTCNSSKVQ